jgi:hypothetical protein
MSIGITGKLFHFIRNFLTGRTFQVKINNSFSESFPIHSGVPQGSVLGPLLFLIYINDLPESLPPGIGIKIYADDVKLYAKHRNDQSRNLLKASLQSLESWSIKWKLNISPTKCKALYIGLHNSQEPYFLNGTQIESTECIRDLGVLIDSSLSFSQHYDHIIKIAYLKSHQLLRVLKTRDLPTLIFAYKTYVRPQLEYATEVWNPRFKKDSERMERVQRTFTRLAFRKSGLERQSYEDRLEICDLMSLSDRRLVVDLTSTYKILTHKTHLDPHSLYTISSRSRSRPLTINPQQHTTKTQNNFFHRAIHSWNKLPEDLISSPSTHIFTETLKSNLKNLKESILPAGQ